MNRLETLGLLSVLCRVEAWLVARYGHEIGNDQSCDQCGRGRDIGKGVVQGHEDYCNGVAMLEDVKGSIRAIEATRVPRGIE